MRDLILLSGPESAAQDQRLLTFAASMGVSTKKVSVLDGGASHLLDECHPGNYCFAVSAPTLALMHKASVLNAAPRKLLDEYCAELLVFDCGDSMDERSALSWLTGEAVSRISLSGEQEAQVALPIAAKAFSKQLAGLNFSVRRSGPMPVFEFEHVGDAAKVIMTVNGRPMFVRIDRGPCQVFLLAGQIPDLDEPLSRDHGLDSHYDELIPVLIFLRYCFRESCWHGPESTARLIIDDPVLTEKYGFLDHGVFASSMQRSKYGSSIAFIPWNYWRTSRRNTTRLLGKSPNLTICVHGCDHTNKEFEEKNFPVLDRKAALALHRMESQQQRTGAPFEKVMVFPQGLFSKAAIAALRANNYLAAVNTTCLPTDSGPDDIKLGDFLRPALTRYDGFPIFQRRYPRRLIDFAFDLFLGRPALVVEHHGYFRAGCTTLEAFVADLYNIEPALSWPTLTTQLMRSCLQRTISTGSVEVQFFTRRFQLANRGESPSRFLLSKQEPDTAAIQKVIVDGTSLPFSFEKDFLKLEVQVDPAQVRNIEIVDRERPQRQPKSFGVVHNTGVLLRRGLSEFRDNTLSRHSGLLKVAKRVAKRLKVTGDA